MNMIVLPSTALFRLRNRVVAAGHEESTFFLGLLASLPLYASFFEQLLDSCYLSGNNVSP
jgi:hypothetical protein